MPASTVLALAMPKASTIGLAASGSPQAIKERNIVLAEVALAAYRP